MSEPSPFTVPLTEADLRDVKDDAVSRLASGARTVGGDPNTGNIERFVAPIIEKINRDHDALIRASKDPAKKPADRVDREGVETSSSAPLGRFDFATGEWIPTAEGQRVLAQREQKLSLNMRAVQHVVRRIANEPDLADPWKKLIQAAMFRPLPPGHKGYWCEGCGNTKVCLVRETAIRAIVGKFIARFGDPRKELLANEHR